MKLKFFFGVLMAALFSACSPYNYYAVGNKTLNTANYRSFAWIPEGKSRSGSIYNNDIARDRIVAAATKEMNDRGFTLRKTNPDLLLRYTAGVNRALKSFSEPMYYYAPPFNPWYGRSRYYYYYGYPFPIYMGNRERRIRITENSILIDVIERKSSKVIWRGWAEGELGNPQRAIDEIPQVVAKIFRKL